MNIELNQPELVNAIHAVAFLAFWLFTVVGAISVIARTAYYRAHQFVRPKLLTRDAIWQVGFALSFGLILIARAADIPGALLRDNVLWALGTDIPAVVAAAVFVYFELFVIERRKDAEQRDAPYLDPETPLPPHASDPFPEQ